MDQNNPTDVEILELNIGGQLLKNMSSLSFIGWLSSKINGVDRNPIIMEIATAIASPPMIGKMSDDSKIRYARLLIKAGVSI